MDFFLKKKKKYETYKMVNEAKQKPNKANIGKNTQNNHHFDIIGCCTTDHDLYWRKNELDVLAKWR